MVVVEEIAFTNSSSFGPFTPPDNSLIVVVHNATTNSNGPAVATDTEGNSYTTRAYAGANTFNNYGGVFTTEITTGVSMTINIDNNFGNGGGAVYSVTGYNTSNPVPNFGEYSVNDGNTGAIVFDFDSPGNSDSSSAVFGIAINYTGINPAPDEDTVAGTGWNDSGGRIEQQRECIAQYTEGSVPGFELSVYDRAGGGNASNIAFIEVQAA